MSALSRKPPPGAIDTTGIRTGDRKDRPEQTGTRGERPLIPPSACAHGRQGDREAVPAAGGLGAQDLTPVTPGNLAHQGQPQPRTAAVARMRTAIEGLE